MKAVEYHQNKGENISVGHKICSSCGYGGNEKNISKEQQEVIYQCPMHCEKNKIYNQPGKCPVCNMQLVMVDLDIQGIGLFNTKG
jgi:hypothetical protein